MFQADYFTWREEEEEEAKEKLAEFEKKKAKLAARNKELEQEEIKIESNFDDEAPKYVDVDTREFL